MLLLYVTCLPHHFVAAPEKVFPNPIFFPQTGMTRARSQKFPFSFAMTFAGGIYLTSVSLLVAKQQQQ